LYRGHPTTRPLGATGPDLVRMFHVKQGRYRVLGIGYWDRVFSKYQIPST
jgi:hypothetical protein